MQHGDLEPGVRAWSPPSDRAVLESLQLTGADLGMCVAREVMKWRSDHEQYTDCWVDASGKLTGYYYGRPFSPYRDRNALVEVWKKLDALGLRDRYMGCVGLLLRGESGMAQNVDTWDVHTCGPETACRAALLAVRDDA